jgi:hypothetical protein
LIPYRTPPASVRLGEAAHGPPIEAGAGTGLAADLVAAPVVMVGALPVRSHVLTRTLAPCGSACSGQVLIRWEL